MATTFFPALHEVRIRNIEVPNTDPLYKTYTDRQVIYVNQVNVYPTDPETGKELTPYIEEILKKDSILEVVGNSYFYGDLHVENGRLLLSKSPVVVKGSTHDLTITAPADFESDISLILPANKPKKNDVLTCYNEVTGETRWSTLRTTEQVLFKEDFWSTSLSQSQQLTLKKARVLQNAPMNVTEADKYIGLLEVAEGGGLQLSAKQFPIKHLYPTRITFAVKPKWLHNRVSNKASGVTGDIFVSAQGQIELKTTTGWKVVSASDVSISFGLINGLLDLNLARSLVFNVDLFSKTISTNFGGTSIPIPSSFFNLTIDINGDSIVFSVNDQTIGSTTVSSNLLINEDELTRFKVGAKSKLIEFYVDTLKITEEHKL